MKIFYVGDNRARQNFGCRATSIALSLLLRENNEVVSKLGGLQTHQGTGPIIFHPSLPSFTYRLAGRIPAFRKIWGFFSRKFRIVKPLGQFDFVREEPKTSLANLLRCLPANPQLSEFIEGFEDCDCVVINGEGTFISSTSIRRDALIYLMFIYWAETLGKPVHLVNSILSLDPDEPESETSLHWFNTFTSTLSKLNTIWFRDRTSLDLYKSSRPNSNNACFVPDALFSLKKLLSAEAKATFLETLPFGEEDDLSFKAFDSDKKYIAISGNSLAAHDQTKAKETHLYLIESVVSTFPEHQVLLVESCAGDEFMRAISLNLSLPLLSVRSAILAAASVLGRAELFISGRFHPSIMASLHGTPCIWLGSNSHKCLSIQQVLEYPNPHEYPAFPSCQDVDDILKEASEILREKVRHRSRISSIASKLSNQVHEAYSAFC